MSPERKRVIGFNVSIGKSPVKPSPKHKYIYKAGDIIGSDVAGRIDDYRLTERIDDILGQMLDWDVDVDQ